MYSEVLISYLSLLESAKCFSEDAIYSKNINKTNPLGFHGRLADAFAKFMKEMWSGLNQSYEPTLIKVAADKSFSL